MTATQPPTSVATTPTTPTDAAAPIAASGNSQPTDPGLINLRTAFILIVALVLATPAGTVAGLAAGSAIDQHPVLAGVLAGLAAGGTTLLTVANSLNSLISRNA